MTVRGYRAGSTTRRARGRAGAAAALACAVVLAGCSNHSGLRRMPPSDAGTDTGVALPAGLAGSASATPTGSASRPGSRPASPASTHPSAPPSGSSTAAVGPASHGGSRHSGGSSSTHRPKPPPAHSSSPASGSARPPAPSVGVNPASGLHGGQSVSVSGAHFGAGEPVQVDECLADLSSCAGLAAHATATGSGSGAFRTSVFVTRIVQLSSCHANGCVIRVRRADGDVYVVPISFG